MKIDNFKHKFWGIVMIILFVLTLYLFLRADRYFSSSATQPTTEEEKEDILNDDPEGVPRRFWN